MTKNESRKENDNHEIGIERLLSPKDVSEILGISVKTVNKLVREGKLGCGPSHRQRPAVHGRATAGVCGDKDFGGAR